MKRARRAYIALLTVLCAIACGTDNRGGVLLNVKHDVSAPLARLDRIVITVSEASGKEIEHWDYRVPQEKLLPNTIGIVSNGEASAVVRVVVSGYRRQATGDTESWIAVDRRDAILAHIPIDRVEAQDIVLSARCASQVHTVGGEARSRCTEASPQSTCNPETGGCMDAHLPRGADRVIGDGDASDARPDVDAGGSTGASDATEGRDGAADAGDVTTEGSPLDGSQVDEPLADGAGLDAPVRDASLPDTSGPDGAPLDSSTATSDVDAGLPDASRDGKDRDASRDALCFAAGEECVPPLLDAGDADALVDAAPDATAEASPPDASAHVAVPEPAPLPPPSCRGGGDGRDNCGPRSTESCCTSHLLLGDRFNRSNDPLFPATVSDVFLDKYEITVGRFRAFTRAVVAGWRPVAGSGKHAHLNAGQGLAAVTGGGFEPGWSDAHTTLLPTTAAAWDARLRCDPNSNMETWAPGPGNEQRPMNCFTWYEAHAFCIWDGGFLPSEAEWNFAASAGPEQRVYPWSSPPFDMTIDPSYASYSLEPEVTCDGDFMPSCDITDLIKVGTKPKGNGRFGQADLTGNVWEWTLDAHQDYVAGECRDCANVSEQPNRVVRGGALGWYAAEATSMFRDEIDPTTRRYYIGARCARVTP